MFDIIIENIRAYTSENIMEQRRFLGFYPVAAILICQSYSGVSDSICVDRLFSDRLLSIYFLILSIQSIFDYIPLNIAGTSPVISLPSRMRSLTAVDEIGGMGAFIFMIFAEYFFSYSEILLSSSSCL